MNIIKSKLELSDILEKEPNCLNFFQSEEVKGNYFQIFHTLGKLKHQTIPVYFVRYREFVLSPST